MSYLNDILLSVFRCIQRKLDVLICFVKPFCPRYTTQVIFSMNSTIFMKEASSFLKKIVLLFRSSHWRCSVKKVFLKISQNSQDNTCVRVSLLMKLKASDPQLYLKERLWRRCFPVNVAKFLRAPFLQEHILATASVLFYF